MNDIRAKTAEYLAAYSGKRLALAVSGGRDSMCLLDAVARCGAIDTNNIVVVHVNHCLRAAADSDESFVKTASKKYGVKFRAFRVDVNKAVSSGGGTVEQVARDLRYAALHSVIKSGEADYVLTAHHALDNAETVLMHMFRGSGLDGLRGMRDGASARVLRPFLSIYPNELDEYVKERGIAYVVDDTNFSDDADRNFLRLNVLPLIEQRYVGATRAINALAAECGLVCDILNSALDRTLIGYDRGAVTLADKALYTPLAPRYVRAALDRFTTTDITRDAIMRAVGLKDMRTGAVVELPNDIRSAREYGCIAFYIDRPQYLGEKPFDIGENYIDGLAVDATVTTDNPKFGQVAQYADMTALGGAVLRFRRDGDMFMPFGGGRKKLKQYFIDRKIPKRLRDRIPLVCKGSEVLVAVGLQVSERAKVTDGTTSVVRIELRSGE